MQSILQLGGGDEKQLSGIRNNLGVCWRKTTLTGFASLNIYHDGRGEIPSAFRNQQVTTSRCPSRSEQLLGNSVMVAGQLSEIDWFINRFGKQPLNCVLKKNNPKSIPNQLEKHYPESLMNQCHPYSNRHG